MSGHQLWIVSLTGVLSAPHCIVMCGGIVSGLAIQGKGRGVSILLSYNAGRVLTYTMIGGVMGAIGSFLNVAGTWSGMQSAASMLGGVLILLWTFRKIGIPFRLPVPSRISIRDKLGGKGDLTVAWVSGLLFGFIPCGLTYAMQMNAAASGSIISGAAIMAVFGISTIPSLLAVGLFAHVIGRPHRLFMLKAGHLLMVTMGILSVLRGMAANGWISSLHPWLW